MGVQVMANKVAVLGSINVDTTYHVERFPEPGETIQARGKSSAPGGKGANQAVAAARSGAQTYFFGMVGNDSEGQYMKETLAEDRINTDFIGVDNLHGTGTALVTLDSNGQNDIMVFGGSNQFMTVGVLDGSDQVFDQIDFLITQFETPQEVALAAFKKAKQAGVITILNPAPASEIMPALLQYTDVISPNEIESALLTGIKITDEDSLIQTANYFRDQGVATTLITLGEKGVFYSTNEQQGLVPAFTVKALDTTAAGDTFIGALASQLATDFSNIKSSIVYAQRASSLAVQKAGALPSIPTGDEIKQALAQGD